MTAVEKMFATIEKVKHIKMGNRDLTMREWRGLIDTFGYSKTELVSNSFNFGFARGQAFEQAKLRKGEK